MIDFECPPLAFVLLQTNILHCIGVEKDETINMESFSNFQRYAGSFEENEEKGYKWQYEG